MPNQENFRGRIARGFAWEGLSKLAVQIVSWVSTIWVARLLSPDDYGLVATSGLFTAAISIVTDFGLGAGLVTRKEINAREINQVQWLNLLMSGLFYGLLFTCAPFIAAAYELPELTNILRVAGLGLLISAWRSVPYAVQLRALNYRFRATVEMTGQFIQAGLVVILALHDFGAWSLILGYLASQLFMTIVFAVNGPKIGRPVLSIEGLQDVMHFGVRITGARALGFAAGSADMAMITSLLGARAAGVYSVAFNLASAPLDKIGAIFNRVAYPAVARMSDHAEKSQRFLLQLHFALLAVASPVLVGVSLTAPDLIPVLLTATWAAAVPVLQVVCIANVVRLSGMLLPVVLEARGRADLVLRFQIVSATLMPLGFYFGSHWGLSGITAVWLLVYPFIYFWLMHLALNELGVRISTFLRSVLPVVFANIAMAVVVLGVRELTPDYGHVSRLAVSVAAGVVSYVAAMAIFVPRTFWHEVRTTAVAFRQ